MLADLEIETILGWLSAAAAWASTRTGGDDPRRATSAPASTLIATSRFSEVSRARYTSPIPPAPNGAIIS